MAFNTVQEVTKWRAFTYENKVYDLSHLDAQTIKYTDNRKPDKPVIYRFIVTYDMHCFTEGSQSDSTDGVSRLIYRGPKESRPFSFERYNLSKSLPHLLKFLGKPDLLVSHVAGDKYAIVKQVELNGEYIQYLVPFVVFREAKKFRLHVVSAYPKTLGRIYKVNFFAIAQRLAQGRQLPQRPR